MISLQIHALFPDWQFYLQLYSIFSLHKRQEGQKCKQWETEMAAAAEHAEEHAAQIHDEEYTKLQSFLPIEPQTHYQEDNIYRSSDNSRIKER